MDGARYVVAFLGARDHYESAVALAEAGKLRALLTDFYTPDPLARLARRAPSLPLRRQLLARTHPRLASALVRRPLLPPATTGGGGGAGRFLDRDRSLGRAAARLADRTASGSLIYSYYWPGFVDALQDASRRGPAAPKLLFQVHPVPSQVRAILSEDRQRRGVAADLDQEERLAAAEVGRYRAAVAQADGIVAPSRFVARGLSDIGYPRERIAVVPYGVRVPAPAPARRDDSGQGPLKLLWVGQLSYRKGPHVLFTALRSLPESAVTLTMVCRGHVDPALRALAPDNVTFVGPVDELRLAELYRSHDVFVMPSLVEGFGLVYLEAMGHGLPVVATPNTGVADLIDDGANGLLVTPGDVTACAEAIERLLDQPAWRAEMSEAASHTARRYTWERFRSTLRDAVLGFESAVS